MNVRCGAQISVSRAGPYGTAAAKNGPSGSAYITYRWPQDARRCIETVHGAVWEGAPVFIRTALRAPVFIRTALRA